MKKRFLMLLTVLLICTGIAAGVWKNRAGSAVPNSPLPNYSAGSPVDTSTASVSADDENTELLLTAADFLADYDHLWKILDENYFYFPYLEKQGINVESLRLSTRSQLEERITDADGFYFLLEFMFRKMQNFAHLDIVTPAGFDIMQKYYNSDGAPDNGWKTALQDPQAQAFYTHLKKSGEAQSVRNRNQMAPARVNASYDSQLNAAIFKITSFDDGVMERDRDLIREYLIRLGDVEIDHIIFDISGNEGGSDLYWQENIVAPFGGSWEWTTRCYLRDTELMRSYFFHDFNPKPVIGISGGRLPKGVEELCLTHYFDIPRNISADAMLEGDAHRARRWVVTDGQVYSSADSFSAFCRETGWATVIGQTTGGDGKGLSPILVLLPRTGILVRFSGLAAESPDGELNAIAGTRPDIQTRLSGEDVYELIKRISEL